MGEGLGSRAVADLEFYPSIEDYHKCYVRLSSDASFRDDTIPKETIIYEHSKAQSTKVKEMRTAEFTNTQLSAFGRKQATFIAPNEKAVQDEKPMPILEECKLNSLALPHDSENWLEVQHTFTIGRLVWTRILGAGSLMKDSLDCQNTF